MKFIKFNMRFIIYKGSNLDEAITLLNDKEFSLINTTDMFAFLFGNYELKLLVDMEKKSYYIFTSINSILEYVKGRDVITCENIDEFRNVLYPVKCSLAPFAPGYYVKLQGEDIYYGIIVDAKHMIYFDKSGNKVKYLRNYTTDHPFKILEIRKPTDDFFKFNDMDQMPIIWTRPAEKVKKTIADIEKELNLTPGTLEIYG
jgi:hypothetical protein